MLFLYNRVLVFKSSIKVIIIAIMATVQYPVFVNLAKLLAFLALPGATGRLKKWLVGAVGCSDKRPGLG